jgi:hypothetical protein
MPQQRWSRPSEAVQQAFALYQGTTLVVPPSAQMVRALAPVTVKSEPRFQEKVAQGLKPDSFLRLYGTTEVVP